MPSVILWKKLQWVKHFQCSSTYLRASCLKAGILLYIVINKKDDDRRGAFINTQKTIGGILREKEQCLEGKKRIQQVMDEMQISHQAITCITCKSKKVSFRRMDKIIARMDKTITFLFCENCISFNIADPSSFARMIEESIRFVKQNPFQSYKDPSRKGLSGELLDEPYRSTDQLAAPIHAIAKKFGATGHL